MTVPSIHSFIQCRVHNSVLQYVFASCALVAFSSISDCIMHFQCTLFEYIYPKFDTNMLHYNEIVFDPRLQVKTAENFPLPPPHIHSRTHACTSFKWFSTDSMLVIENTEIDLFLWILLFPTFLFFLHSFVVDFETFCRLISWTPMLLFGCTRYDKKRRN